MQLIVVLCLIAKLALVSGDCDVGKTLKDFDYLKFTGTWYGLYHPSNEHEENIACVSAHIDDPVGNVSAVVTYRYDKRARSETLIAGFVSDWDNTGFTVNYPQDPSWDGRFYPVAIDYKRYCIHHFCPSKSNKLLTYAMFRSKHPDKATLKEVEKILQDNNLNIKRMASWDDDRCRKL